MRNIVMAVIMIGTLGFVLLVYTMALSEEAPEPEYHWNDFSLAGMAPTAEQVQEHLSEASSGDRDKAMKYISMVLSPRFAPPSMKGKLRPLKGWQGKNVFLVRGQVDEYVIQIMEAASPLTVTVVALDRQPTESINECRSFANRVAREILRKPLLPSAASETHQFVRDGLAGFAWVAEHPIDDDLGVRLGIGYYHTNGRFVRFEFPKETPYFASAAPPPYIFPPPEPAAQVQPINEPE